MISIRKYEAKDYENVKFACLNAEGYNSITDYATEQLVLHTFCEYYIEREPQNCFVVDDDMGKGIFCNSQLKFPGFS